MYARDIFLTATTVLPEDRAFFDASLVIVREWYHSFIIPASFFVLPLLLALLIASIIVVRVFRGSHDIRTRKAKSVGPLVLGDGEREGCGDERGGGVGWGTRTAEQRYKLLDILKRTYT